MRKCIYSGLLALLGAFAFPTLASVNVFKYTQSLQSHNADLSASSTLLGIIESCGNSTNINDDCVMQALQRVAVEENNSYAKQIASNYMEALDEGNYFTAPECQMESHAQANRILAHCILLMNYYALKDQDKDSAVKQYEMCLQGGMQGLVYQGNIVAQYILGDLYEKKGLSQPAEAWKKTLKLRKDTEEYQMLMKCYN
jgi:hypothetical protein